jgi:hypothetical protein
MRRLRKRGRSAGDVDDTLSGYQRSGTKGGWDASDPQMSKLWLATVAVALFGATYVGAVFFMRSSGRRVPLPGGQNTPQQSEFTRIYGGNAVKILQFYARDGNLTEGEKSVLCYGVLNAKTVRIEPPVDGVGPALNRCVEIVPQKETQYTLTAEGTDGKTVSESFVLGVHADEATLPKITRFGISKRERDYTGKWIFSLSFAAQNPEEVSIEPAVFKPLHRSPMGSFYVAPDRTTIYTLTVTGKNGHKAQKSLTVEVPGK